MKIYFHYALSGLSNVYFVGNEETREALIIDPSEITTSLVSFIENDGFKVSSVLITHNHGHHTRGLGTLLRIYDAEVYSSNSTLNGIPCKRLSDGDRFETCGFAVEAISVPGHTSDSLCYRFGKFLFSGDVINAGFIGSTLSGYGYRLLTESIRAKLFCLSDDHILFPGHGPITTIGAERTGNLGMDLGYETTENRYDFFL